MKKKLFATALIATMVLSMTACGGKEGAEDARQETQNTLQALSTEDSMQANTDNVSDEKDVAEQPEGLGYFYEENRFGFNMWLAIGYNEEVGYGHASYEEGSTQTAFCEVIYVTQYSGEVGDEEQKERIDMTQYNDSSDIFDLLIGNIDTELYGGYGFSLKDYSVQVVETKDINGFEMTKFEGSLTAYHDSLEKDFTYPVVAYGIKASETPVLICCIDRTEEQNRHEYWVDKIDEIAETFREGKVQSK